MIGFIDAYRDLHGVEPICRELKIASSTYYKHHRCDIEPKCRSERTKRDEILCEKIREVWEENHEVYGVRKVWRQLKRQGVNVARCTVARLMKSMSLQGVIRGKRVKTTVSNKQIITPDDLVNRDFSASRPNELWVADFTYVSTWQGFVYVAFIIDVFARFIVGWKVSSCMDSGFVLDALEQALYARQPEDNSVIHHSDRGKQYVSMRYTERLEEAGIKPSVGSVGDSYDNALAETINGLYKAEVIHRQSWKRREDVEFATMRWVHWFNHSRLLEPIGHIPPVEAEEAYYASLKTEVMAV